MVEDLPDNINAPEHLVLAAIGILGVYGPLAAMFLARRRLGVLRTSAWMAAWGVVIPVFEHASFTFSGVRELSLAQAAGWHELYHFRMTGAFTVLAGALVAVVAFSLMRQGCREGWYTVLGALLLVAGFELAGAGGVYHGFPASWPVGVVIYVYVPAWIGALALSYRPIFPEKHR